MKRTTMACAALLGTLMLSASLASAKPIHPTHPSQAADAAAKQCAALKQADRAAFKSLYGKGAMSKCIKAQTKQSQGEYKNAAKECKAEQAADPVAFEATYGDPYSSDAFGKCVSTKVQADDTSDTEEFDNAAQECKAERAADQDAFTATYGTGKKGRNALGKCVSAKVRS
jgi:hypothetical protein